MFSSTRIGANRLLVSCTLLLAFACSLSEGKRVQDVTEKNFGSIINTKSLALVIFYSAGCQPCVEVLMVMQRLAATHSATHPDVKFGRVDINQEPVLAMRFHADEVPAVKAFPHSSTPIAFHGEANEENLLKFLRGLRLQSAVKAGLTKSGESLFGGASVDTSGADADKTSTATATVPVDGSSYASIILNNDTNSMLALHTPECGEPCATYERIAAVFKHEGHHIVFGRVDVTEVPQLARFFQAQRNPTLLWFPRGDKNNIVRYGGDVDLHEIVGFINDMTGTHRQTDGRLEQGAGRVSQIERILRERAADLVLNRNIEHLIAAVEAVANELPHSQRYVQYYLRLLRQLHKGTAIDRVLEKENVAVGELLKLSSEGRAKINQAERDEAVKLHNIVSAVVDIVVDHLQGERRVAEEVAVKEKQRKMEEERRQRREREAEEFEAKAAAGAGGGPRKDEL